MHKDEHEKIIRNYFGSMPDYQPLEDQLTLPDTCNYYIKVVSGGTADDNTDITVSVETGTPPLQTPKRASGYERYYSIQLFKGIEYLFGDVTHEFSKARLDGYDIFTFRVLKETTPVYHGDLSSTFPR
jgi:hypothetical protein